MRGQTSISMESSVGEPTQGSVNKWLECCRVFEEFSMLNGITNLG